MECNLMTQTLIKSSTYDDNLYIMCIKHLRFILLRQIDTILRIDNSEFLENNTIAVLTISQPWTVKGQI